MLASSGNRDTIVSPPLWLPQGSGLPKFHIDSIQEWEPFVYGGQSYCLDHLNCHEIRFQSGRGEVRFVVTYGLHCFTEEDSVHGIPLRYADGKHSRAVCLERYEASKKLRGLLEKIDRGAKIYNTAGERFFTITLENSLSGEVEPYKICLAIFRENRLLRIHVTSAYFARTGEGSPAVEITKKGFSIFKIAIDTQKKSRNGDFPKEVRNRFKN